jgi:tRNA1Val (adenine37-N6)-methyltransferase
MAPFRFKQFQIDQERSAFKVGTDSILLGSWSGIEHASNALDIGTGTGILALMIAQRTIPWKTRITAIEIDEASAQEADQNVKNSPWADRISVLHGSIHDFRIEQPGEWDSIVSNPPYFTTTTMSSDPRIARARHATHLPFEDLAQHASRLLRMDGLFSLILPTVEAVDFVRIAHHHQLRLNRRCRVHATTSDTAEIRHLIELRKCDPDAASFLPEESRLTIETGKRHQYTDEFKQLTGEFYNEFKY